MNTFACFTLGLREVLIMLGIALAIAVAATYLIAVVMRLIFSTPIQTVLAAEAIVLLICAGVTGLLVNGMEGITLLALLGAVACVLILAMNWLYRLISGRQLTKWQKEFCALDLNEQPNFGAAE